MNQLAVSEQKEFGVLLKDTWMLMDTYWLLGLNQQLLHYGTVSSPTRPLCYIHIKL